MKINKIMELGLWPESKKTTTQKGISELEELGYKLFYIGKNADLYTCPGDDQKVLLVRSDRCSVFDIPLNLEIEGKGISQTSISNDLLFGVSKVSFIRFRTEPSLSLINSRSSADNNAGAFSG